MNSWLTFILWLLLLVFLNFTPPNSTVAIFTFFIILFAGILGTTLMFFRKIKINLLVALFLTLIPVLAYFHLISPLNLVLLLTFFLSIYLPVK